MFVMRVKGIHHHHLKLNVDEDDHYFRSRSYKHSFRVYSKEPDTYNAKEAFSGTRNL